MQLSDRIGRRMKLHDLHVLMAVVQAGSMGRAARHLNSSQPAISRSIADLEHALGVSLLDRNKQGVKATEYGRALLDCGAAVFDELRRGVKNIEFLCDPTAGELRIATIPPLAAGLASTVIERLSERHPRIIFHLTATNTDSLRRALTQRDVDLVIVKRIGPFADPQFSFETLYNDSYVVVAGVRSPWARRRKVELADLVNESWVLPPPDSVSGALIVDAFNASGVEYPRVSVFSLPREVRTHLLANGRLLTIFPTSLLNFFGERSELKVLPIKLPIDPVPVGIVTLKNRTLSPVTRLFIDAARETAKPFLKERGKN
jgi:DNA-binding transcriptional LysR family regulator